MDNNWFRPCPSTGYPDPREELSYAQNSRLVLQYSSNSSHLLSWPPWRVIIRSKLAASTSVLIKQQSPINCPQNQNNIASFTYHTTSVLSHSQINSMATAVLPTYKGTLFSYWWHHGVLRRRCPYINTGKYWAKLPSTVLSGLHVEWKR